ncbi:peptidylprolyl isomerase [Laspinema sp. A4]|uniref:foldase protein PrsA n=1 Tax=Laspinema sp. D2d TaxID=2953686 RepID=UPI0021BAC147|nr:peptidylprolyl isomerase [Laspinema sp. D2d]MCT7982170.1 peptidylprolyl isomerase [Laspinema sp. D2d]
MRANLSKAGIEAEEIVDFLKKELQFKTLCEKILYQKVIEEASRERGVMVTPEEIQAAGDRFRAQHRLEKAADTLAWLEDQMISPEDWEAGIRDRLLTQKLAEALFAQQVEKFFAENRIDFNQILLYQIIVASEKVAQEIFYQIEEQEISFYEAAHLYNRDERRRLSCGCEGKVSRSTLTPEIAAAVLNAPMGEVIGPVTTQQGYHLFLVEETIPAELTPELRQQIIEKMFKEWLTNELTYFIHSTV